MSKSAQRLLGCGDIHRSPTSAAEGPAGGLSLTLLGAASRLKAGRGEGTGGMARVSVGSRLPYTHSGSETGPTCFTADAASASGQQPAGMIRKDHATHFWSLRPGPGAILRPLLGPPPARLRCPHFMDETESRGRFGQAPWVKRQWVPTCTIHFSPWTEQLKLSSSRARWRLTRAPRLGCQPPLGSSRWKNNCGVGPGLLAGPRAPSPCTRGAKQPAGEPWGGPGWGWGTGHFLRIQGGQGAPSQMWGAEGSLGWPGKDRSQPISCSPGAQTRTQTRCFRRTHCLPAGPVLGLMQGMQTPSSPPPCCLAGKQKGLVVPCTLGSHQLKDQETQAPRGEATCHGHAGTHVRGPGPSGVLSNPTCWAPRTPTGHS